VVVGADGEQVQWDPVTVAGDGAFGALFAPVAQAASAHLATAGRLVIDPLMARSSRSRPIIRS
jgi:hypothetical protein